MKRGFSLEGLQMKQNSFIRFKRAVIRVYSFLIVVWVTGGSIAFAGEPTPIGNIVANPQSYQLHVVTLTGTVTNIRIFSEDYISNNIPCHGAYTFTLKDETGTLEILVGGVCEKINRESVQVVEGEKIVLEGMINAPGYFGNEYLTAPRAIATQITRTGS